MDHGELCRTIGRIESKVDALATDMKDVKAGVSDFRFIKNRILGGCAILSVLASIVWSYISKRVS